MDDRSLVPADASLNLSEAAFAQAARAPSTLRGYRSDWREFTLWCDHHGFSALPADDVAISRYISELAVAGAKVGTISRRLSSIKFAHKVRNQADPTQTARVLTVWEGIRRRIGAPPDQARPLMPPQLLDVVEACPAMTSWAKKPNEASRAGARDRAILLTGFVSALRPDELASLCVDQVKPHERGRVIELYHSKTNQAGSVEYVVLPRATRRAACPIEALERWIAIAQITEGPIFRGVTKGNRITDRGLSTDGLSRLVTHAVERAGFESDGYSGHSLRAGFVTYASKRGATAQQIANQTRHRALSSVAIYTRHEDAWDENAATGLGL